MFVWWSEISAALLAQRSDFLSSPPPPQKLFVNPPLPPCCFYHLFTHPPPLFFFFLSLCHSLLFPRCQPNFDTPYSDYWLLSFCERRANLHVVAAWSVPVLLQACLGMVPTLHAQQDVVGTLLLCGVMSGVGARVHTQTHLRAHKHRRTLWLKINARARARKHARTYTYRYTHTGLHTH